MRALLAAGLFVSGLGGCFVDVLGEGNGLGGAGGGAVETPAVTAGAGGGNQPTTTGSTATATVTTAATTVTTGATTSSAGSTTASTGMPTQTCEEQYGTAAGYSPCTETATECHFGTIINYAMSCGDVCATFGGTCIDAYANGTNGCDGGPLGCSFTEFYDLVCVCSHDPP